MKNRNGVSKKRVIHTGFRVERCRFGLLERIFAEHWLHENRDRTGYGSGILQLLFTRFAHEHPFRPSGARLWITRRDAMVAATVIQWLGTNVGYCFLETCIRRAGGRIEWRQGSPDDSYYSCHTQQGYVRDASAWHNIARDWAFTRPARIIPMRFTDARFKRALERRHGWRESIRNATRMNRPRCQNRIQAKDFDYACGDELIAASGKCPRCDVRQMGYRAMCRICGEALRSHNEDGRYRFVYIACDGVPVKLGATVPCEK